MVDVFLVIHTLQIKLMSNLALLCSVFWNKHAGTESLRKRNQKALEATHLMVKRDGKSINVDFIDPNSLSFSVFVLARRNGFRK